MEWNMNAIQILVLTFGILVAKQVADARQCDASSFCHNPRRTQITNETYCAELGCCWELSRNGKLPYCFNFKPETSANKNGLNSGSTKPTGSMTMEEYKKAHAGTGQGTSHGFLDKIKVAPGGMQAVAKSSCSPSAGGSGLWGGFGRY